MIFKGVLVFSWACFPDSFWVIGKCQHAADLTGGWELMMPVFEVIVTQKTPLIWKLSDLMA